MSTHPAPRQPRLTALFLGIAVAAAVLALLVGLEGSLVANGAPHNLLYALGQWLEAVPDVPFSSRFCAWASS